MAPTSRGGDDIGAGVAGGPACLIKSLTRVKEPMSAGFEPTYSGVIDQRSTNEQVACWVLTIGLGLVPASGIEPPHPAHRFSPLDDARWEGQLLRENCGLVEPLGGQKGGPGASVKGVCQG